MAIQLPNPGLGDGQTGDNEFVMWTKVKDNFSNTTHAASRLVGESAGNVLEVGAFGIGGASSSRPAFTATALNTAKDGFIRLNGEHAGVIPNSGYSYNGLNVKDGAGGTVLVLPTTAGSASTAKTHGYRFVTYNHTGVALLSAEIYTTENTLEEEGTGHLYTSSPVILLRDGTIDKMHEAEDMDCELIKNSVGDYTLKNTTGLREDEWHAVPPKDVHGNPLCMIVVTEPSEGEVNVKTYKRKFDLEKAAVVADLEQPFDIPEGASVRLHFNDLPQEQLDEPIE